MIKQLLIRFILFVQWIIKQLFSNKPQQHIPNEKTHEEIYINTIIKYETTPDEEANKNIIKELYDKDARKTLLEIENNPTEKQWTSRILMEHTKNGGNIIMYYDCFKMTFAYYSDNQSLSNKDLFYAAMKYVVKYRCRDFLIDPENYPDNKMILLIKQEDKQLQTKTTKSYIPIEQQYQQPKIKNKRLPEKNLIKTKFTRIGKLCEFNILQKPKNEKIMLVNKLMFDNKPLTTMNDFFDELDIKETDTTFTKTTVVNCSLPQTKPNSYAEWKKQQKQQQQSKD